MKVISLYIMPPRKQKKKQTAQSTNERNGTAALGSGVCSSADGAAGKKKVRTGTARKMLHVPFELPQIHDAG